MKIYRSGSGGKYTPFNHFEMTTEVMFNPASGSEKVNFTLSTLNKGAGSEDEVHPDSDQVFYMLQGKMKILAGGELKAVLNEGDAVLVKAGEVHAVINEEDEPAVYNAVTVPPLDRTH